MIIMQCSIILLDDQYHIIDVINNHDLRFNHVFADRAFKSCLPHAFADRDFKRVKPHTFADRAFNSC